MPRDFVVHFRMNRQVWERWGAALGQEAGRSERSRRLAAFIEDDVRRLAETAETAEESAL
jgi:hypothetical protein